MQKIKNLTNSPYDLQSVKGPVRLPAFGEVEGEFSGEYLDLLRASGAVSMEANEAAATKAAAKATTPAKAARKNAAKAHAPKVED